MKIKESNTLRIIGGKWRGRKITFPSATGLRPTQDRIRETVFNWLMNDVVDARCLDLFAGSGALGIEALSRGAQDVTFIDHCIEACRAIQHNLTVLGAQTMPVIHADYHTLAGSVLNGPYHIVFLDPPFGENRLASAVDWLVQQHVLHTQAKIYIEVEKGGLIATIPQNWNCSRHKSTSTLDYYLFDYTYI